MKILNAVKIALANFALVFKNLLFKIILFVFFGVILVAVVNLRMNVIVKKFSLVYNAFMNCLLEFFKTGTEVNFTSVFDAFKEFVKFLDQSSYGIAVTVLIAIAILTLYNYFSGFSDCVLTILTDNYMSSMSKLSFLGVATQNIKKISVFQLFRVLYDVLTWVISIVVSCLAFYLLNMISVVLAVFGFMLTFCMLIALKNAFFSGVMTNALISNKGVLKSIKDGFRPKKSQFAKMLEVYFIYIVTYVYMMGTVTVFTLGVGLLLFVPLSTLIMVVTRVIDYYTKNEKKYFVDFDTIIVPKSLREDDVNLLNNIDI